MKADAKCSGTLLQVGVDWQRSASRLVDRRVAIRRGYYSDYVVILDFHYCVDAFILHISFEIGRGDRYIVVKHG